jgi:hypothetical protein
MFEKGDKVIPISKSVGDTWDKSSTIKEFLQKGYLIFLHKQSFQEKNRAGVLVDIYLVSGDFYILEDLIPYGASNRDFVTLLKK